MKTRKTTAALLSLLLALSCLTVGCSDAPAEEGGEDASDSAAPTAPSVTAEEAVLPEEEELAYTYEIPDLSGRTFTFLNAADELWSGTFHVIDYEEEAGELVQDALFRRARLAEEDMNMTLSVEKFAYETLHDNVTKVVASGGTEYDATYMPLNAFGTATMTGKNALNLHEIDSLHFDEPWHHHSFIEQATILGDTLYETIDYINMMGYVYSNVLYFNRALCDDLHIEYPYTAVREGKWTYDAMFGAMEKAANLNGDAAFACERNGNCVFGLGVQHSEGTMTLLNGCGSFLVSLDSEGVPQINPDTTRVQAAFEKLCNGLGGSGMCIMVNGGMPEPYGSITLFCDERALFYQGCLGISAADFRQLEFEYGVIPAPKLDETQENYFTMVSQYTLALMIPKSVEDSDLSGKVVDYMSYLGLRDVIPDVQTALCYKGMRDEDSIEMFNTMLNTVSVDIGYLFGWSMTLVNNLSNDIYNGNNNFMSQLAANSKPITQIMKKIVKSMQ